MKKKIVKCECHSIALDGRIEIAKLRNNFSCEILETSNLSMVRLKFWNSDTTFFVFLDDLHELHIFHHNLAPNNNFFPFCLQFIWRFLFVFVMYQNMDWDKENCCWFMLSAFYCLLLAVGWRCLQKFQLFWRGSKFGFGGQIWVLVYIEYI